jgi:hypothetical protein
VLTHGPAALPQKFADRNEVFASAKNPTEGEFINRVLLEYCTDQGITFTRSRPYLKNDTCHVEQKN